MSTACGSPCYAAPEMIAGKQYEGPLADIWSMGVILFALVCGFLPFEDQNTSVLYRKILAGDYKPPKWISAEVKDLIRKILETDPKKRYRIPEIRRHTWYCMVQEDEVPKEIITSAESEVSRSETFQTMAEAGLDVQALKDGLASRACNSLTAHYYLLEQKFRNRQAKIASDAARGISRNESVRPETGSSPPDSDVIPTAAAVPDAPLAVNGVGAPGQASPQTPSQVQTPSSGVSAQSNRPPVIAIAGLDIPAGGYPAEKVIVGSPLRGGVIKHKTNKTPAVPKLNLQAVQSTGNSSEQSRPAELQPILPAEAGRTHAQQPADTTGLGLGLMLGSQTSRPTTAPGHIGPQFVVQSARGPRAPPFPAGRPAATAAAPDPNMNGGTAAAEPISALPPGTAGRMEIKRLKSRDGKMADGSVTPDLTGLAISGNSGASEGRSVGASGPQAPQDIPRSSSGMGGRRGRNIMVNIGGTGAVTLAAHGDGGNSIDKASVEQTAGGTGDAGNSSGANQSLSINGNHRVLLPVGAS